MTYSIAKNAEYNSVEIMFDGKPSAAVRDALKSLKCRWHGVKKCWYGRITEEQARAAIDGAEMTEPTQAAQQAEEVNAFGVRVGDIFSASWGWEQTNNNFFQVVALVGRQSVRVREVYLPYTAEAVSSMAEDRTYKITHDLLPAASYSVFIHDQEHGDLKRLKPGYNADPEEARKHCYFKLSSYCDAHRETGDSVTVYESWYA